MAFLKSRSVKTAPASGPPPAWSRDLALAESLQSGDGKAFRVLVAEHGPWMLRLARRRAPSEAVAEEIVQEAWLAALQGLGALPGPVFRGWRP